MSSLFLFLTLLFMSLAMYTMIKEIENLNRKIDSIQNNIQPLITHDD